MTQFAKASYSNRELKSDASAKMSYVKKFTRLSDLRKAICSNGLIRFDKQKCFNDSLKNSMKLVILFHSLYWSIHTKDESKRGTAFAFIFGVN